MQIFPESNQNQPANNVNNQRYNPFTSGWTQSQPSLKGPRPRIDLSYRKKIAYYDFDY